MSDIDTVVVGAGVVGLAVARAFARRGQAVMILERNPGCGEETSSRNSGVIHAGIYYPTGSLKARLCVKGKHRLYRFCDENQVPVTGCGKLLVATSEAEVPRLENLKANAEANGVDDLEMLTADQARQLEPGLNCVAACLSPSTGVVNVHRYIQALEGHLQSDGGDVVLNTTVTGIEDAGGEFAVRFDSAGESGLIRCLQLVLCAGLGASELARKIQWPEPYQPPQTWPAKGHYFRLDAPSPFRHLVYPMPDGAWLGTHLTLDTQGQARFGPDNEWTSTVDYGFDDTDGERKQRFVREIQRYWPKLAAGRLSPDYTGVRPKIYRPGEPVADFAIHGPLQHGIDNLVALYGIESPGLTSALAIGDYVVNQMSGT